MKLRMIASALAISVALAGAAGLSTGPAQAATLVRRV